MWCRMLLQPGIASAVDTGWIQLERSDTTDKVGGTCASALEAASLTLAASLTSANNVAGGLMRFGGARGIPGHLYVS